MTSLLVFPRRLLMLSALTIRRWPTPIGVQDRRRGRRRAFDHWRLALRCRHRLAAGPAVDGQDGTIRHGVADVGDEGVGQHQGELRKPGPPRSAPLSRSTWPTCCRLEHVVDRNEEAPAAGDGEESRDRLDTLLEVNGLAHASGRSRAAAPPRHGGLPGLGVADVSR